MWETQHNNADWDCFKILILQELLKTQNRHQGEILCIFGSRTFVPISWICQKQTSVSHCSTEAEVISLDAGLRMDGIPVLDLWDLVIEVFHVPIKTEGPKRELRETRQQSSSSQTCITPSQSCTPTSFQQTLVTFRPIQRILVPVLCCMSLRTMRR